MLSGYPHWLMVAELSWWCPERVALHFSSPIIRTGMETKGTK
jgi:hypothetical protein